ncbi:molybdenum cofactor synthesis domain-containing protein [candidate division KSB1 bacterium]
MSDRIGRLEAVCIGRRKGQPKEPVDRAELRAGHGLVDDIHAGDWHRQISLIDLVDIDYMRSRGMDKPFGAFGENFVIEGLPLNGLGLGSVLRLGGTAEVSITQIGKDCHSPCDIYRRIGDCIMPRAGLFSRVVTGGDVAPGDTAEIIKAVSPETIQATVITVSDSRSRGEAEDTAGPAVAGLLINHLDADIFEWTILPDDRAVIEKRLKHYCDGPRIDLVVTVGGTGFSPRDVTPEATRAVVDRLTPGFDEAMRAASFALTPNGILSRGVSGIRRGTLIINLPGSHRAAVENLEVILPVLEHGLGKLRGDATPCDDHSKSPAP